MIVDTHIEEYITTLRVMNWSYFFTLNCEVAVPKITLFLLG